MTERVTAEIATRHPMDGNRPLPFDREMLGRKVREAWVRWALTQPNPKSSWLVPYDDLPEPDKEADRQIGEDIARWTLIGDAAAFAMQEMVAERSAPDAAQQAEIERLRDVEAAVREALEALWVSYGGKASQIARREEGLDVASQALREALAPPPREGGETP